MRSDRVVFRQPLIDSTIPECFFLASYIVYRQPSDRNNEGGSKMAKSKHTFAKRQREMDKKLKAEEKRDRRHKKKGETDAATDTPDEDENTRLLLQ